MGSRSPLACWQRFAPIAVVIAAIAYAGCTSHSAPTAPAAPASITGSWVFNCANGLGAQGCEVLELSDSADSITGAWKSAGTYPQPVSGTYKQPNVSLDVITSSIGSFPIVHLPVSGQVSGTTMTLTNLAYPSQTWVFVKVSDSDSI